jgi:hypothetical protein
VTVPIGPEVVSAIRARARILRRRRIASFSVSALLVVGVVTSVVVARASSAPRAFEVATGADCPADSVPVYERVGDSATLTDLPAGWALVQGQTDQPDATIFYADPRQWSESQKLSQEQQGQYWVPWIQLAVTFQAANPSSNPPNSGFSLPAMAPTRTATTEVDGFRATAVFSGPADRVGTTSDPNTDTITWRPASGVTVSVEGVNIPAQETQAMAEKVHWNAGRVVLLADSVRYKVSTRSALRSVPAAQRPAAKAVLTSWAEVDRTGQLKGPGLVDYRAVWLVYAGAERSGYYTWSVVDANSGVVLQSGSDSSAGWVTSVTDRSQPGCEPPLGALTRQEITRFDSPGTTFVLTTLSQAYSAIQAVKGSIGQTECDGECDPLVWLAEQPGGTRADIFDAVTGSNLGDSEPAPTSLPADLDPD